MLRHNNTKTFIRHRNHTINVVENANYVPLRYLSSIAGIDCFSSKDVIHCSRSFFNHNEKLQRRWFLGCGDGQEGSVLSKVYEERLVIG